MKRSNVGLRQVIQASAVTLFVLQAAAVRAETLAEAISLAYQSNPTLISQRAQLDVTDETYVQAEAGFRPTVSGQAMATHAQSPEVSPFGGQTETDMNTGAAALSITQPLYTGGRVTAEVRTADAQIRAGREQLRSVEASVVFAVIQAYSDVVRDRATLVIQKDSYKALADAVNEIRARYEAGANTITDRYQAETQLESSRALVDSARAQLDISVAEYVTAVGQSPGELASPPPLPTMPADIDQAFDICERESPSIRQAQFNEAADRAQVQQAEAARRPTLSISGVLGSTGPLEPFLTRNYMRNASVSATLNQPIFTGGVIASQVRQALAQDTSARVQVDVVRRAAIQSVSQAWSQRRAAHLNTVSEEAAARSALATFEGMRVEYRAGLRTTLDVLTAQETLRDIEIAVAAASHDEYVASASVVAAIGRLEARVLLQGNRLYSPEEALRKVEHVGSVPWQFLPAALDRVASPRPPQPSALPEPDDVSESVRMAPVTSAVP